MTDPLVIAHAVLAERDPDPRAKALAAEVVRLRSRIAYLDAVAAATLPHYHRRSNVETTFAMIKAKFGAAVASRLPIAQVNEVLAKCVAHNLCCVVKAIFTAGLAPTFWPDAVAPAGSES